MLCDYARIDQSLALDVPHWHGGIRATTGHDVTIGAQPDAPQLTAQCQRCAPEDAGGSTFAPPVVSYVELEFRPQKPGRASEPIYRTLDRFQGGAARGRAPRTYQAVNSAA